MMGKENLIKGIILTVIGVSLAWESIGYLIGIRVSDIAIVAVPFLAGGVVLAGLGGKILIEDLWARWCFKNPIFVDLPPLSEVEDILRRAKAGDAEAQYMMSTLHSAGHGVVKDAQEAFRWTQLAANGGDKMAQFLMGNAYRELGNGLPIDLNQALEWYHKAADQGYALACLSLSGMYEQECVPKDLAKAKAWYDKGVAIVKKDAEAGDRDGQNLYGLLYKLGMFGHPQDYEKAKEWYSKAANQGDAMAMLNLGYMYRLGEGVPKDEKQAIEWFSKAVKVEGKQFFSQFDFWTHLKIRFPQLVRG
ncbi:MAG: sel1 repeat family protein [Defluviitaleaceae bacterium]|nr:sel1 repeat family protein [Defluviitaleaceae bacterium]